MKIAGCRTKPDIEYPCPWLFKVIGYGFQEIEQDIKKVVGEAAITVTSSHVSPGGKYHSVNLEMEVVSEEHRLAIYRKLGDCDAVKVVL